MSKYRVAVQMYTLRDFAKTPEDVRMAMKKSRKAGYDCGQISAGFVAMPPNELCAIMTGEGIEPIGAHLNLDRFRADLGNVIETCHGWGVEYVAIPWLPPAEYKVPLAGLKKLFKEFDGYAVALKKEGITLQYHNHTFEFEKIGVKNGRGGTVFLDMLYENTKHLQAELDFGWLKRGGGCPVAWATKMKGRLDQVHLKDWGIRDDQLILREIGEGCLHWPEIIKACKASGTKHFLVEQDECPMTNDIFKSLAISRQNLAKMGL